MITTHRSRTAILAFVTILAFTLSLPFAVHAQEQVITEAQVVTADESAPALAPVPAIAPESSVEASRVLAAEQVLQTGDIGSMQEEALLAVVAVGRSWDETSGYGSVEARRATIGHPATSSTQIPSDVRWVPDADPAWMTASRAAAARRAAPDFPEWDAARWSPLELGQATSPDSIPMALASGQRAESAHLATVPIPGEAAVDGASHSALGRSPARRPSP